MLLAVVFVRLQGTRRALLSAGRFEGAQFVIGIHNALVGYFVASLFLHAAYPQIMWMLLAMTWASSNLVPADVDEDRKVPAAHPMSAPVQVMRRA